MYADDVALTVSAPTFREAELALSHDISVFDTYLTKWKLRLSVEKTVCSVFHLKNRSANYQLNVKLKPNVAVKFDSPPSYLGICLDRSLLFRTHLHTLKKIASSRVALIKRLAGVGWGASFKALRTSILALAFAPSEYCAPAWCRSAHTKHIDVPLNESMCVITGCPRSTPSSLPILSGITPPETRRSASCLRLYTKALNPKHLLHETLYLTPSPKRLRSRKRLRSFVELLSINGEPTTPIPAALQSFIPAFGPQPPGCDFPGNAWVQLNCLRTGVGRFAANMKLMGLCGSDLCASGKVQTAHHILHDCTKIQTSVPQQRGGQLCLLFWNTLPNQSSDQHVFLFMCTKEVLSAVYLLLLTQSLVRLSRHTHRKVMSQQKYGQIMNCGLTILIVIGVRGGGDCLHPGLKNFRATLFFMASTSCSKIQNVKSVFNTLKIFRATLFFRASAKLFKNLNDKKYFNRVKNFRVTLFFRASTSCSKILNVKSLFNTVKNFRATLFFRASAKVLKNPEW